MMIETFTFLDWWNDQTIKTQQDWFKRHTRKNDRANYEIAVANQKAPK